MLSKEQVLNVLRAQGLSEATQLQQAADNMSGTELYAHVATIPEFRAAVAKCNMLDRDIGFVCKSSAGRVVKLLQRYDSSVYTQEPEDLPAQWGFQWSQNLKDALPFVSIATSPYNTGDCCIHEGRYWISGQDGNIWAPGTTGVKWTDAGPVGLS